MKEGYKNYLIEKGYSEKRISSNERNQPKEERGYQPKNNENFGYKPANSGNAPPNPPKSDTIASSPKNK